MTEAMTALAAQATQALKTPMTGMEAESPALSQANSSAPFAGFLQSMVQQTNSMEKNATDTVVGLMNGSGVEIHDAMIATQKADMAFELALQVRNKAVGAYQQMMGMQF